MLEPMKPIPELQRVVCAAIRHKQTQLVLCGARHFDYIMLNHISETELEGWADADQGFIDQWGNFLTRQEAYIIAERQGQLTAQGAPHTKGILYSEDLY